MKKKLVFALVMLLLIGSLIFAALFVREWPVMEAMETPRVPPPLYPQVHVESVDELLEWIRTVETETFQSGRYTQVVSLLRASGQTLVPSFDISGIELRGITVLQDYALSAGSTMIFYVFFTVENERIAISVRNVNTNYIVEANRGIENYAAAALDEVWSAATLSETTIQFLTEYSIRTETVQTLTRSDVDDPDVVGWRPFTRIIFLVDGFELWIQQDRDRFRDDILESLRLEVAAIE